MSYSDKQLRAKLRRIRDRAVDEFDRIVFSTAPDQKHGWNGYAKCAHVLEKAQNEIERQDRIETMRRENTERSIDTKDTLSWMDPPAEETDEVVQH